jgi:DNA-binding response OmpR family regulator
MSGQDPTIGPEAVTKTAQNEAPRGRIVIAEDDEATRMLLTTVLTRARFAVCSFANGQLAFDAVRADPPDIILFDWVMPVMDGRTAAALLKADAKTRGIPIIMLTTHSQIEERVMALESGVQDFLTKPFDARELIARIDLQMRWRKVLAVDANQRFAAERLELYSGRETRIGKRIEGPAGDSSFFDRIWGASGGKSRSSKLGR